jgi:hypothetical protein
MTRLPLAVALVVCSSISFANPPSDQLVQEFIQHSRAEKIISEQIDATMDKLGSTLTPDVRKEVQRFYESTMGWSAIKDDYAGLVKKTYSADQLKAIVTFEKSPVGSSVAERDVAFSRGLGELIAGRMQQASLKKSASPADSAPTESPLNDESLKAVDVVEHVLNGATYFTGTVENHGSQTARSVEVEVDLFAGGKFVDQYTSYLSGSLPSAGSRYFKVACGCKDSPPASHDSFKVEVHNGF